MLRYIGAYVDGELDAGRSVEVEAHVEACSDCRRQLAVERILRKELSSRMAPPGAPELVRVRARTALRERWATASGPSEPWYEPVLPRWTWAAAAAVLLGASSVVGLGLSEPGRQLIDQMVQAEGRVPAKSAIVELPILHDVVNRHSHALPSDVEHAEQVEPWFRGKVPFQVRPVEFERFPVRMTGARLSHVRGRQAATLYYNVGGRRLTVVVFESPAEVTWGDKRVRLGKRELPYHEVRGYTVPIVQRSGLVYAITGDLDRRSLLQLAASARMR
ncbi:MAG: zf-HC2 domain-containing protein [Proteobacteria bacterium]|nr:zf-HC2 domain-containing protein [Pseudomonadota bacterium]